MPTFIVHRIAVGTQLAAVRLCALAAACALLGGCTSDSFMSTGPERGVMGGAGGGSEAVFDTPEAVELLAGVDAGELPEYSRRDAALGLTASQPMLATAEWPQAERPNVDNLHSIYIPNHTNVGTLEYPVFRPGYGYGYGYRHGGRWYWRAWRP